jgi:hypothetical protein
MGGGGLADPHDSQQSVRRPGDPRASDESAPPPRGTAAGRFSAFADRAAQGRAAATGLDRLSRVLVFRDSVHPRAAPTGRADAAAGWSDRADLERRDNRRN